MTQATELRTLLHLLRGQRRRGSHAQSLRDFYAPQAEGYDAFRERLLHGRETLVHLMAPPARGRVVEMGCGTGRNLDFFGARVETFRSFDLVDVCVPLLEQARRRAARWPGIVNVVEADAENYRPDHAVDCVYFSYSLSMTADWHKALCNAVRILRPGGTLGVVDFFVSEDSPPPGLTRHGWLERQFWRRWFAHDGVRLDPRHLHALMDRTDPMRIEQHRARIPWLPLLRVPYYLYVGKKKPRSR